MIATAVLHNVAVLLNDQLPNDEPDNLQGPPPPGPAFQVVNGLNADAVRRLGQHRRDVMCAEMPPRRRSEPVV